MKVLAANVPEYFPSLHFYQKMIFSDVFIIADDLQYSKHSRVNRTKISSKKGLIWLTVPVITSKKGIQKINQVKILEESNWKRKHLLAFKSNFKYMPYFEHYFEDFMNIFYSDWKLLISLNVKIIKKINSYLKINYQLKNTSDIDLEYKSTSRIIELVKKHDCDTYLINSYEEPFIDLKLLDNEKIKLVKTQTFIKGNMNLQQLSIIEFLFKYGNESYSYLKNNSKITDA